MKLSIWWPTYGNAIRMGRPTNRMGGATSFPYPAPPSQVKSLLKCSRVTYTLLIPVLQSPRTAEGTFIMMWFPDYFYVCLVLTSSVTPFVVKLAYLMIINDYCMGTTCQLTLSTCEFCLHSQHDGEHVSRLYFIEWLVLGTSFLLPKWLFFSKKSKSISGKGIL